jgi:hypothetical protein
MSPNPYVFLVGSARSGTTLLQRIVDAHPEIAVTPETHWVPRWYERRVGLTSDDRITPALLEKLFAYRRFPRFGIAPGELRRLAEQPLTYSAFVGGFYDLYGRNHGKRLVGDKTGEYARRVSTLHGLWPSARFVHLIRDGRDVCLSVLSWKEDPGASRFATWHQDPVSTTALWWRRNVRMGREAGASLSSDLYYEVRYEALVAEPERECAALCDFLGVPYDQAILRFHEGRTTSGPGLSSKDQWLPITPGLRDWKSQMPPEDVERFEAVAGDLLDELGYPRAVPQLRTEALAHALRIEAAFAEDLRSREDRDS